MHDAKFISPYLTLPLRTRAQADNGARATAVLTSAVLAPVWVEYAPRRDALWPVWMADLAIQIMAIEALGLPARTTKA